MKQQRTPIRSPWPTSAHPLTLLTDKRIESYILRGFYGRARQEEAKREQERRAKSKVRRSLMRGDREAVAVARLNLDGLY